MLKNGMCISIRRSGLAVLLMGTLLGAAAQTSAEPPAWGLILGLRSPDPAPSVQLRQDRERANRIALEAGLTIHSVSGVGRSQLLRFEQPLRGTALQDAVRRARLHPDVEWVEPNVLLRRLDTVPNDPAFAQQWALQTPSLGGAAALNLPPAWDLGKRLATPP